MTIFCEINSISSCFMKLSITQTIHMANTLTNCVVTSMSKYDVEMIISSLFTFYGVNNSVLIHLNVLQIVTSQHAHNFVINFSLNLRIAAKISESTHIVAPTASNQ
jgi:hypothetical protein